MVVQEAALTKQIWNYGDTLPFTLFSELRNYGGITVTHHYLHHCLLRQRQAVQLVKCHRNRGCRSEKAKGSHTKWTHPKLHDALILSGGDGDDAKPYQEAAILRLEFRGQFTLSSGSSGDSLLNSRRHDDERK